MFFCSRHRKLRETKFETRSLLQNPQHSSDIYELKVQAILSSQESQYLCLFSLSRVFFLFLLSLPSSSFPLSHPILHCILGLRSRNFVFLISQVPYPLNVYLTCTLGTGLPTWASEIDISRLAHSGVRGQGPPEASSHPNDIILGPSAIDRQNS